MPTARCESIHESILKHLSDWTTVEHVRDLCVVTLPVRTVDGRLVDVFVESRSGDYFLIHDAGKAANELILHGVDITPSINHNLECIASSFGTQWADEMFQARCKVGQLNSVILGVAMSSSFATIHLLEHVADVEGEAIRDQVGSVLKIWSKKRARIQEHVVASGAWSQHTFDFVAFPKGSSPLAVSVLLPSGNPINSARNAAYRAKDLEGTSAAEWKKVIVEAHAETWTRPAKNLIAKCSDAVIELNSGENPTVERISKSLNQLLNAA